jgi:hypothetical protein
LKTLRLVWAASAVLSLILLASALGLPQLLVSRDQARSLAFLKKRAEAVRQEFRGLLESLQQKKSALAQAGESASRPQAFASLQKLNIRPEIEGAAAFSRDGRLETWLGNVPDLEPLLQTPGPGRTLIEKGRSFIVMDKASVYVVRPAKLGPDSVLLTRLLSFRTQFRSPYLFDFQFLKPSLSSGCDIDYWDFREDLSGFEKIFARHQDEYLGQPSAEVGAPSLIFPLRLEDRTIAATVTLSSPTPTAARARFREKGLLFFSLSALLSGLLLLALLAWTAASPSRGRTLARILFLVVLVAWRWLFLFLRELGIFQPLRVFSPAALGFRSLAGLTRSPADLALTAFFILLAAVFLTQIGRDVLLARAKPRPWPRAGLLSLAAAALGLILLFLFQRALEAVAFHSNLNLLRFSFSASFLFVQLGLFCLALALMLALFWLFRLSVHFSKSWPVPAISLALAVAVSACFLRPFDPVLNLALPGLVSALLLWSSFRLHRLRASRVLFFAAVAISLFLTVSLNIQLGRRNRNLVQNTLKDTILSQEEWASFFLQESLETINQNQNLLLAAFRGRGSSDSARRLWIQTAAARFNWYSSLEILDGRGETISRFALNVPRSFRPSAELGTSQEWTVSVLNVALIGRDRPVFIPGLRAAAFSLFGQSLF